MAQVLGVDIDIVPDIPREDCTYCSIEGAFTAVRVFGAANPTESTSPDIAHCCYACALYVVDTAKSRASELFVQEIRVEIAPDRDADHVLGVLADADFLTAYREYRRAS
jgi:hypothetical protein